MAGIELFKPPDEGVRFIDEYPELADTSEFRDLSDSDMLFTYLMGCPSSPYFEAKSGNVKQKRTVCFAKSHKGVDGSLKTKYINGTYPDTVRVAIERFARFRPSARMRAKIMVDNMFDNFEMLVNIDDSTKELIAVDPDEGKKYIAVAKEVTLMIPKLLDMKEGGFGISTGKDGDKEKDNDPTLLDLAM